MEIAQEIAHGLAFRVPRGVLRGEPLSYSKGEPRGLAHG